MMKKVCMLLAIMFVLCLLPLVRAEGYNYSTEKLDAFQFCELYVKRLIELEKQTDFDLHSSTIGSLSLNNGLLTLAIGDDLKHANCSGGSIGFDADNYIVQKWDNILVYMDDEPDVMLRHTLQASIAISVLEYDNHDELWMSYVEKTTPVFKAYNEIVDPIIKDIDVTIRKIKAQKTRRLVYQGKYNYYIDCIETSDGRDMVMILAE